MSVTTFTGSFALINRSITSRLIGNDKRFQSKHNNNNSDAEDKMTTTTGNRLSIPSQQPLPLTPGNSLNNPPTSVSNASGSGTTTSAASETAISTIVSKVYGKIILTTENVLIPKEKILQTPSFLDGMDAEMEWETRLVGCELISSAGILLKLPQTAMATGQVLFHRFYYCKSFLRQEMEYTAMACIYLASKIEEAPRRIRDVINVFHHLQQLRNGKTIEPMILDQHYIQTKSDVTLAERRVLKELGFCVHVKHPHKLIVVYMQQLGYDRESEFVQMSWNYMSDALRSNVFVRYKPEAIACACIFLSARKIKIVLPNNPAWYIVFDVSEEQIMDICETILELYDRPRTDYDQFMKKLKCLRKEFKDNKEKAKAISVADRIMQGSNNNITNASPLSRPASPNPGSGGSAVSSTHVQESSGNKDREKRKLDGSDNNGRKSAGNSPEQKKSKQSPSPIVYDLSPQRHSKKKKRRKSRSESSSPSSRSKERRLSSKKQSRRDRTRSRSRSYSPKRSHHKKSKSHHKDRYRSRSRSYSPGDRGDDRYDRNYDKYYKKSSKSSKHLRDREEDKSRSRDKMRR